MLLILLSIGYIILTGKWLAADEIIYAEICTLSDERRKKCCSSSIAYVMVLFKGYDIVKGQILSIV